MKARKSRTPQQKLERKKWDAAYRERHRELIQERVFNIKRECEHCGRVFLASKFDLAKGWGRFCSQACHYASVRIDRTSAEWQEQHKEKYKAAKRRYRQNNHERVKALDKFWNDKRPRLKTLPQIRAERLERAKRTEKACTKCGIVKPVTDFHRNKHASDGRATCCALCTNQQIAGWKKKNSDKLREYGERRRAVRANIPGSHTTAEWHQLCKEFDHRCVCCGSIRPLTLDHVIPIKQPGSSDFISNCQPLCRQCNASKGSTEAIDYRETPFVRRGQKLLLLAS